MYKERATVGFGGVEKGSRRKHTANRNEKGVCIGRGCVVTTGVRVFKKQLCVRAKGGVAKAKERLQRAVNLPCL